MLLAHDHSELDAMLSRVFAALADADGERAFHNLDEFWARLAMHIRAENIHLFPALLQASDSPQQVADAPNREAVQEMIVRLRDDHDFFMSELTAAMKELRELRRGNRPDASSVFAKVREQIVRVSERLETHNALEESQVYHWADALLDQPEQKTLSESIQRELENLPPRLRKTKSDQGNSE